MVHLRLDVFDFDASKLLHFDLVEVTDAARNRSVLVLERDGAFAPSGEEVNLPDYGLHLGHLEALHARLQGVDRVDFRDAGAGTADGEGPCRRRRNRR